MEEIRRVRDKQLAALDVGFMRALGKKDQSIADSIEAEKQRLRDLPQTFDLSVAQTVQELKALWPAGLPRN